MKECVLCDWEGLMKGMVRPEVSWDMYDGKNVQIKQDREWK